MGFTSSQTSKAAGLPKAGKSQTPELSTSKVSQTSASEPIIVKTKKQLNKVLEQNPQAEVKIGGGGKGDAPDPEDVAKTIEARINNFTKRVLGYSQEDIKPEGAGVVAKIEGGVLKLQKPYTKAVIKLQQKATSAIERGLASESAPIRLASQLIEGLFRGAGMSPARAEASRALGGEIATAQWRNYNIGQQLLDLIGMDSKSLERVNAVLDPALAKQKIKFSDLTPEEKQLYGLIREGLDLVHDISYSNGFISKELYLANKGKYTPRLYEPKELPPEVNDMVNQMLKKINLDIFKKRKDIDAWKIENSLNNPVYGLVKRLTQVQINSAVKKYTDFLASQKHLISDTPRIGFTQLSDSPAYGALAGKYVLNSAAEDLKGFFFANEGLNKLYDVFRIYDGLPPRQLIKKLLTVFNPTTNVGNIVSDNVFGFLVGVNPYTLNKNILLLKQDPKQYKAITEYLMRKGIVATDITRTDFVNDLAKIDDLADIGKKTVKTKSIGRRVGEFYAGTDDVYKAAAFKALIDRGLSFEEAAQRVFDGFQNYKNVGKFYDVFAKTPIIGEPFIKFQGDLIRIIKNAAVNNPLGLITFLGTLKITADLFSKISGETPEDRKTREERFAAPYIPILNIPLTWQTPIGEINVARYISPFFANRETSSVASKMLPFIPQTGQKDVASFIAQNAGDPMTAPIVQALVDRDFRGKPIADKNETKYKPSTLTPEERMLNRATFLARGYTPPFINSVIDVVRASQGKENMYGAKQTTAQALARMAGVKIQQFGPKEAEEYRQKEQEFQSYKNEDIDKRINSIYKQLLKGEITQEQADKRIKELEKQKVSLGETKSTDKIVRYIDENDQLKKIDIGKVLDMPATTETEMALKIDKAYKLLGQIEDIPKKEEQDKALQMLGVPRDKAEYYWVASKDTDVKYAYVIDQINNKSGEEALSTLVKLRQEYNNRSILTNKVIDQLVDNEVISSELGSYLKKIEFSGGKIKVTGRPKKISIKKIQTSLPAKIKVQKVDIKSMSKLLKLKKAKRIKIKAKKIGYK
ncbi:MAG: hypothetical protein KatS3mg101_0979 [Patescibacteria group bacterium]|nr:MAG: hypothetical protein KatS3mg101_0979 [Patescibacteria group bacterium]